MIFSSVNENIDLTKFPKAIEEAVRFCMTANFDGLSDGRHEISGDDSRPDDSMFYQLWHLQTKPMEESKPELHKRYIDLQFWLEGGELCGVAPAAGVGKLVEAHDDRDLYFYDGVANEGFLHMTKGCFAAFFPYDAHRPGLNVGDAPQPSTKVVVKIRLDRL